MARYPNAAIQALVYSDGTLTPDDLNKLSATDSSAAELNLLDGLNAAGSATASKVVTLDANSAVSGIRRKVLVDADGAAGKYLTADAVGEWVKLVCVKTGQWQVIGYAGTWAHEG